MTSDALRAVLLWSGVLDYEVLLWRNRSAEHQRVDIVFVKLASRRSRGPR